MKWSEVKFAQSCLTLCDPMDYTYSVPGILQTRILECVAIPFSRGSSQPRIKSRSPSLHVILYQLSHQGSPRMLEWVAYPFSSGSSPPRDWTSVSCIAGRFFTNWFTRKLLSPHLCGLITKHVRLLKVCLGWSVWFLCCHSTCLFSSENRIFSLSAKINVTLHCPSSTACLEWNCWEIRTWSSSLLVSLCRRAWRPWVLESDGPPLSRI